MSKLGGKWRWAALGVALLALDGAAVVGAQKTWSWLASGEGAAVVRSGRNAAHRAYAVASERLASAASDLAVRAIERTAGVYGWIDSVTPERKSTPAKQELAGRDLVAPRLATLGLPTLDAIELDPAHIDRVAHDVAKREIAIHDLTVVRVTQLEKSKDERAAKVRVVKQRMDRRQERVRAARIEAAVKRAHLLCRRAAAAQRSSEGT